MTNEQCIAVAEKVWGWTRNEYGNWCESDGHETYIIDSSAGDWDKQLEKQVNSWQGFGRTVEAMAKKGSQLCIEYDDKWGCDELGFSYKAEFYAIKENINSDGSWNPMEPKTLIEATHLAALEALK